MKKNIFKIVALTFALGAVLIACNTPAEKVEKAQEDVREANMNLDKAQEEYLRDIENYRKTTDEEIAANDTTITNFKAKIKHDKADVKAEYDRKIAELEEKNREMKKKIDNYKAEGKEKWELFKADFNKGMDEIGQSLKDLTAKHPSKN